MRSRLLFRLVLALAVSTAAGAPAPSVDRVVVYKQQHKLVLLANGKEVRSYRVALGTNPVGPKRQEGDHRTPEGTYVLDYRNPRSQYYKTYHISYPNAQDVANAKKLGVRPGGDVMIHALPKAYAWLGKTQALHDWTWGCIAVSNGEMDEIWQLVRVGTPIDIRP